MSDVVQDIKDHLESRAGGQFAATSGWGIYISREPPEPDTVITLYPTGSASEPNAKWRLEHPTFQVRVRGAPNGYQLAQAKAESIKHELLGLGSTVINSTLYVGIWMTTDIIFMKYDDNNRPIFVMSYRTWREPSEDDNRTAL